MKFKVGDRVKCVKEKGYLLPVIGKEYVIAGIVGDYLSIKIDENSPSSSTSYTEDMFELIQRDEIIF